MSNVKNLEINKSLLLEVCKEKIHDEQLYKKIFSSNYTFSGEFEAYYFSSVRSFFRNNVAHRIMKINQDIPPVLEKIKM